MKKVLFIVHDDFGELVLIRLFSLGQNMDVHVALPDRLYPHFDIPGITKTNYSNVNELKVYAAQVQPEVVLLFCGYLFVSNEVLTRDEFDDLLAFMKSQQVNILTSDPCLLVYDLKQYETEADDRRPYIRNALKRQGEKLVDIPHIYAVPFISDKVKVYCYKNPALLYNEPVIQRVNEWTFVLAKEDYLLQTKLYGDGFYSLLYQRIMEAISKQGVVVNVILPGVCARRLSKLMGENDRVNLIEFCDFTEFEHIIARSSVLFYWNVFSASILLCRLYNKPVLLLHKGHMVHLFDKLYDHALEYWYPDSEPVYIDIFTSFGDNINFHINRYIQNHTASLSAQTEEMLLPVQVLSEIVKQGVSNES